ncbi:MAG: substrate-binding domain-containing protein [Mycobacterium leprae]
MERLLSRTISSGPTRSLRPTVIAGIFSGRITRWNDPAIKQDNPTANLPSTGIIAVHRSDISSLTESFTGFLAATAGSDWGYGSSKTWQAPSGQGAKGREGVATLVAVTPGAISYMEPPFAKNAGLRIAKVINGSGKFAIRMGGGAGTAVGALSDLKQ